MIYLKTSSDGVGTEGIGAMAQYQLNCYAMSKLLGVNFCFDGFKNIAHFNYFPGVTCEQFSNDWTQLFSFPFVKSPEGSTIPWEHSYDDLKNYISQVQFPCVDFKIEVSPSIIMKFADANMKEIEKLGILKKLIKNLTLKEEEKYFKKDEISIAVHIRKYTGTDCDLSPVREYFNKDSSKKDYYFSLIENIKKDLSNKKKTFYIYSQGNAEDLMYLKENLQDTNTEICLKVEEYPIISFYHMTMADILLFSNSSFSYVPSLYGKTVNFIRDSFYHKTYTNNLVLTGKEGKYDSYLFAKVMGFLGE